MADTVTLYADTTPVVGAPAAPPPDSDGDVSKSYVDAADANLQAQIDAIEVGGGGSGDALTSGTLDQFSSVTQAGGAVVAFPASGTHSGTNTGDNAVNTTSNAYADSLVVGLLDDRGNYNASGNAFPAAGGSGAAGAVLKGDLWVISTGGNLGGSAVTAGDVIRALINTPGQTASNWVITENNLGYVPEVPLTFSTGLTRTTNTITVNASQTQITAVGTLTTGTWNATTITIANGGTGGATVDTAKTNLKQGNILRTTVSGSSEQLTTAKSLDTGARYYTNASAAGAQFDSASCALGDTFLLIQGSTGPVTPAGYAGTTLTTVPSTAPVTSAVGDRLHCWVTAIGSGTMTVEIVKTSL